MLEGHVGKSGQFSFCPKPQPTRSRRWPGHKESGPMADNDGNNMMLARISILVAKTGQNNLSSGGDGRSRSARERGCFSWRALMLTVFQFANSSTDVKSQPLVCHLSKRCCNTSVDMFSSISLLQYVSERVSTGGSSGIPDIVANSHICCLTEVARDSCTESLMSLAGVVRVQKEDMSTSPSYLVLISSRPLKGRWRRLLP